MGALRAGFHGTVGQPSAQVIDGSLKFDGSKPDYLTRTPSSASNRKTWTWSAWVKRNSFGERHNLFGAANGDDSGNCYIEYRSTDRFQLEEYNTGIDFIRTLDQKTRDTGFIHWVVVYDSTQGTDNDKQKIYKNGVLQTDNSALTHPSLNEDSAINNNQEHRIGVFPTDISSANFDGAMAQVYFIDGQALGPENFGFTDGLTGTWRPKKFKHLNSAISTQYSGASTLTWDDSPIGSIYTLSNNNKTATAGGGGSGYSNADVWSIAIPANSTYAWTLDITNGDGVGGWYFTDAQTDSGTHADQRGGNSLGMRPGTTHAGYYGTFASANGGSNGQNKISMPGASAGPGFARVDFVVYRPASGTGKVWVKNNGSSAWVGGGDPSNTSSTPSFIIPDGTTYFGFTFYDRTNDQIATFDGDGSILQKIGGNSFYLPMDGNSQIGEDKSGRGNNWTLVNFGGSVAPDNPIVSGARPILNTLPGGTQAGMGVFGSKENATYTATGSSGSGSGYVFDGVSGNNPSFSLIRGATYTFNYSAASGHPIRFSSTDPDSSTTAYTDGSIISYNDGTTWSDSITPSDTPNKTRGFNGNTGDPAFDNGSLSSGQYITFTPPTPIAYTKSVAIYTGGVSGMSYSFNGGGATAIAASSRTVIATGSGTFTSFALTRNTTTVHGWTAIEIDGVVLVDGLNEQYSKITVPHDAPNSLWYYCKNHSNMNGDITVTTDETKADKHASSCVLAMPLLGTNGDLSNSINPTSATKVMTNVGNAAASSDSSNFYAGSFEFDGSGDGITCPDNTDFEFGSGDFTVECWVKQDDTSSFDVFVGKYGGSSDGEFILGKNGNTPTFYWQDSSGNNNINATNFIGNTSVWYHLAGVREGNVFTLYVNGICENSTTDSTTIKTTSNKLTIGFENDQSSSAFDGYLQDVRIYKGVAKYSGTTVGTQYFVPPATNPDVLPDTPSGVSGSSKLTKITDGAVAFDGSGDSLSLTGSSDVQFGTGIFTAECFVYADGYPGSGVYGIFDTGTAVNGNRFSMVLYPSGLISIDNNTNLLQSSSAMRSNAWNHVAFVREGTGSNEAKLYINGVLSNQATISTDFNNDDLLIGKTIDNYSWKGQISNVRIVKGTAVYTSDFTPPSAPLTNVTNTKLLCCQSNTQAGSAAVSPNVSGVNNGTQWSSGAGPNFESANPATNGFNGDADSYTRTDNANVTATVTLPSSVAFSSTLKVRGARDSGNGTITVNGVDVSSQFTSSSATLETVTITGVTSPLTSIALTGISGSAQPRFSAIYIDDVMLVDPLTPNGDAAATTFNPFNTDINTVRGQETGYATMNPIGKTKTEYFVQDGNLTCGNSSAPSGSSGARGFVPSTIGFKTGKWYAECETFRASDGDVDFAIGIFAQDSPGYYANDGKTYSCRPDAKLFSPGGTAQSYGVAWADGDCIGIKVDMDSATKTIQWLKNGIATGDPVTISTDHNFFFGYGSDGGGGGRTYTAKWNFGQKPFKFPPPDGFQSLNGANVRPETVIARPDQHVGVLLYTGNGSTQSISGLKFGAKPDFVWIKQRSSPSQNHALFDSVRGPGHNLSSSTTHAERSDHSGATGDLRSFDRNGFSLGSSAASGARPVNLSGKDIVAWCWKAGGNKGTFNVDDVGYASASDAGLTGTNHATLIGASIGTKQGFSIIRYQGGGNNVTTVSHGLSQSPQFMIIKNIDDADDWTCYHEGIGNSKYLTLNSNTDATTGTMFNDTTPTSNVFTLGAAPGSDYHNRANRSGYDYIAYLWHDVPGLQKFGTYRGSSGLPFVECGFRPALIILKKYDGTDKWCIYDTARGTVNTVQTQLHPDTNDEESGNSFNFDILSNGFRPMDTSGQVNENNKNYIFAAWAEAPFINLYGGSSNAR